MKCKVCGNEISSESLHQEPQRDRQGNTKTTAKGKILYYNYHKTCFLSKQKEKQEWDSLYEFCKYKFFINLVPSSLIKELKEFRKYYDYKTILGCLESIVDNLVINMDKIQFNNDFQKSRYIASAISNNIQSYKQKEDQKVIEEENIPVINFDVFKKAEQKNKLNILSQDEDYDILD